MVCIGVRLSTVLLLIYFVFSSIALVWAIIEISVLNAHSDRLAFMSGLIMFVLGTWKGMLVATLNRKMIRWGPKPEPTSGNSTPRLHRPIFVRSAPPVLGDSCGDIL